VSVGRSFATLGRSDADVDVNSAITAILDGSDCRITASIGIIGEGKAHRPTEGSLIWGRGGGRLSYKEPTGTIDEYDGQTYTARITDDLSFVPLTRKKVNAFFEDVAKRGSHNCPHLWCFRQSPNRWISQYWNFADR
jgi:hypothetical protein